MKKQIAMALCLLAVFALTGCAGRVNVDEPLITRPPEADTPVPAVEEAVVLETQAAAVEAPVILGNYTFVTNGVELIPGSVFDPSILPAANSVYEVPSCAIEGTDNLYNYGSFELTAFDDGTNELIYSILLIDPNITTTEGLALGDSKEKVFQLYGDGCTQQGTCWTYSGDAEQLILILQGETVASIEYRMIVD